jgi:Outer membrane protein beta-barrel domain
MKKTFTFVAFFALLSYTALGQFSFGVKGGASIYKVQLEEQGDLSDEELSKNKIGISVSSLIEFAVTKKFALQLEPSFTQKGANYSFDFQDEFFTLKGEYNEELNYIEVPLLAKFRFTGEKTGPFLVLGPSFGKLILAESKGYTETDGVRFVINERFEDPAEEGLNTFEMGLCGGGGFQLNLGDGRFLIDARYHLGLSNIINEEGAEGKAINKGFVVSAGYLFGL